MKRSPRYITSLAVTAIYLLVSLASLATSALHSGMVTQLLTAECTGDCRICGCSQERSAARACCCWQKKLAEVKSLRRVTEQKSCPTATAAADTRSAGNCCSKSTLHAEHIDEDSNPTQANFTTDKKTATLSISTCPCGSGKDLFFPGNERLQHIPFRYLSGTPIQAVTQFAFLLPERLATRSGEPPDPPPKIYILS